MFKLILTSLALVTMIGCATPAQFTVNPKLTFASRCPLATQELSAEDNAKCFNEARQSCLDRGLQENCWATEKY